MGLDIEGNSERFCRLGWALYVPFVFTKFKYGRAE